LVFYENSKITDVIYVKLRSLNSTIMIISMSTILCSFSIFDLSHSSNEDKFTSEFIDLREKWKNIMLAYSSFAAITLCGIETLISYYEIQFRLQKGEDLY